MRHLEIRQKYSAARRIFNFLLSVSAASSETQGQSVGSGERARRKFSSRGEKAFFVPNQEPASAWIFGNSSVRVGTQGLFRPYLKTLVAPFLSTRLTAPGSPRMFQLVMKNCVSCLIYSLKGPCHSCVFQWVNIADNSSLFAKILKVSLKTFDIERYKQHKWTSKNCSKTH